MNECYSIKGDWLGFKTRNIPALISGPFQILSLLSFWIVFWSEFTATIALILGIFGLFLVTKKPRLCGELISLCAIFVGIFVLNFKIYLFTLQFHPH